MTCFSHLLELVALAVKLSYAITLNGWFPLSLREPSRASVIFWEATSPQSNYPPCSVLHPVRVGWLRSQESQGWYFKALAPPCELAPRHFKASHLSYMKSLDSLQSYSKGAQGLSVLPRVLGIFTTRVQFRCVCGRDSWEIVPSADIRAGRNLPDKEFRYLRTVIVTAAVYRGFGSPPRPYGLTGPLNLPALGRRQTIYIALRLSIVLCVFAKQSLPTALCDPPMLLDAKSA